MGIAIAVAHSVQGKEAVVVIVVGRVRWALQLLMEEVVGHCDCCCSLGTIVVAHLYKARRRSLRLLLEELVGRCDCGWRKTLGIAIVVAYLVQGEEAVVAIVVGRVRWAMLHICTRRDGGRCDC